MAPAGIQRKNGLRPEGEEEAEVKDLKEGRNDSSGGLLPRGDDTDLQILHNVV